MPTDRTYLGKVSGRGMHAFTRGLVSRRLWCYKAKVSDRRLGAGADGGGVMSFFVEGDYFEVCNCDVSCNCVWLGAATHDNCDVLLAWHVTRGSKDGVDLSGLNAVMAVHSPKRMTDGGWKVALYLDDRASAA